jgi:hypothetical protein
MGTDLGSRHDKRTVCQMELPIVHQGHRGWVNDILDPVAIPDGVDAVADCSRL